MYIQLISGLMLAGIIPAAFAGEPASFSDYAEKLNTHPQRLELLEMAEQQKRTAKSELGLPDPMLGIGINNLPVSSGSFHEDRMTSKTIGVSQDIPNPAWRKAKAAQKNVLAAQTALQADYTTQKLIALFISALAKHQKTTSQIKLAQKQLAHYQSLEGYFQGQIESGRSVYWRFSDVDVEKAITQQRLNDLEAEKAEIEATLVRLVGDVPPAGMARPDIKPQNLTDIAQTYPIRLQEKTSSHARAGVQTAKAAILPDFGLEAGYSQRESINNAGVGDLFSVKARVSIPLWYASNQKPKLDAAKAQQRATTQALEDTRRTWQERLKTLREQIEATGKNIKLLAEKKQSLQEITAATRRMYEAGNGGFDAVLNAQISALDIAHALAEKRAQHISLTAAYNSHFTGGF